MSELERSYRRLLLAYPASYRAEKEDEIVGVLLDCAEPGQRRARPAEAIDVLVAGLRTRMKGARPAWSTSSWPDALAIVTVLLALLAACRSFRSLVWLANYYLARPEWATSPAQYGLLDGAQGPLGWLLVAALIMVGLHRLAGVAAVGATALELWYLVDVVGGRSAYVADGIVAMVALQLVAMVLLLHPRRTARGVEVIGRKWLLPLLLIGMVTFAPHNLVPGSLDRYQRIAIVGALMAWPCWRYLRATAASRQAVFVLAALASAVFVAQIRLGAGRTTGRSIATSVVLCLAAPIVVGVAFAIARELLMRYAVRLVVEPRPPA